MPQCVSICAAPALLAGRPSALDRIPGTRIGEDRQAATSSRCDFGLEARPPPSFGSSSAATSEGQRTCRNTVPRPRLLLYSLETCVLRKVLPAIGRNRGCCMCKADSGHIVNFRHIFGATRSADRTNPQGHRRFTNGRAGADELCA